MINIAKVHGADFRIGDENCDKMIGLGKMIDRVLDATNINIAIMLPNLALIISKKDSTVTEIVHFMAEITGNMTAVHNAFEESGLNAADKLPRISVVDNRGGGELLTTMDKVGMPASIIARYDGEGELLDKSVWDATLIGRAIEEVRERQMIKIIYVSEAAEIYGHLLELTVPSIMREFARDMLSPEAKPNISAIVEEEVDAVEFAEYVEVDANEERPGKGVDTNADGSLEDVLRGVMRDMLEKLAAEELVPEIRKKIVEEFGMVPQIHRIETVDGSSELSGIVHGAFDDVAFYVANNIPVFMVGPSGSGKNVIAQQVAESLGLEFHYMNSVTDEFKITGFIDAGGTYHGSEFRRAFEDGGLFMLDEMDASAPEVLVCINAAISNRYFTFPDGRIEAHPDFRVIAAGNTAGTGGDMRYTGRLQLDAASLNRFVQVEVGYDPEIDLECAGGDCELAGFAQMVRAAMDANGIQHVVSYRNVAQMAAASEGLDMERALLHCLVKHLGKPDLESIAESCEMNERNPWVTALKEIAHV